jgi:hypothetical protein
VLPLKLEGEPLEPGFEVGPAAPAPTTTGIVMPETEILLLNINPPAPPPPPPQVLVPPPIAPAPPPAIIIYSTVPVLLNVILPEVVNI